MKVSEEKKQAAYNAISDPIMELRIKARRDGGDINSNEFDNDLFDLGLTIWKRLQIALNIEG